MENRNIYITEKDKAKLKKLFASTIGFRNLDLKNLKVLLYELERAEVVREEDIASDVITMNSTVRVKDLNSNSEFTYTLVYPEEANSDENKISILAPIGTALLGYSVGDIIEWAVPAGKRKLEVKEIISQDSMVHEQE